jgi:hypothetical protein
VPRRRPCPGTDHGALACKEAARAAGQAHASRVPTNNYVQHDCARAQRPERAHACCRPPAALRPCVDHPSSYGTNAQGCRADDTPTKAAHPLTAGVPESVAPAAAPASRPAAPAHSQARRRPRILNRPRVNCTSPNQEAIKIFAGRAARERWPCEAPVVPRNRAAAPAGGDQRRVLLQLLQKSRRLRDALLPKVLRAWAGCTLL